MYIIRRDATPPNGFNISISNVTYDGFTINANTSDNMSGINRYDYIVNGELKYSGNNNNYPVTGLQSNVDYQVYVNAYDNAGNVVSSNVLSQRVLSKWTTSSNKPYATEITIREPSSEQNPTLLRVLPYAEQDISAYITFNEAVKAGSTVSITYMYTRSSNNYYIDLLINGYKGTSLNNTGNNTKKTLNYTMKNDVSNLILQLHKSDISSSNYYVDLYIYEVLLDGRKIL